MANNDQIFEEDITESINKEMDLISKPQLSVKSSIDENIISLDHSFGYDCKKMYNLVLMDKTLIFASGNLINFFDVTTNVLTTRRSACGGGIGCIAKNPNRIYNYLTIAENGNQPTIFIYKFPEMEIISMLRKGTTRQYSILDYTADGELLGSQGGEPDYMLTIWDWKRQEIKLRAKSFSNDVANLMFSPFIPEQVISCGLGHIKFWSMSSTFTGLKLQGLIGRFGKTEICDIFGICPMPDEKILSGCEWGNILVWDGGLIKLEVCCKNRKPCHKGAITQIFMRNAEEIMTVGTDGFIRIWFWETVELSDPPEDDRFVEIEPSHEFRVGHLDYNAELLKIIKNDSDDSDWFAQDGMGGIWWCDLATEHRPRAPKQLFRCHAGEIVAMDTSSISCHVATLGKDGRLYIYDYIAKELIFHHQFMAFGVDLIWLPVTIDPTGAVLIMGFSDGVIRIVAFDYKSCGDDRLQLIRVVKCHHMPITKISVNPKGSLLVSGSEDGTLFVHQILKTSQLLNLSPIGFICVPSPVTCINWNPSKLSTVILGCKLGHVVEADLPERPNSYTDTSFHLDQIPLKNFQFKSMKSLLKRNIKIKEIDQRKEMKRQRKRKELEKLKEENPMLYFDEENFFAGSEDEEELESMFIPDPPNPILWVQYTHDNTLWLSVGGYDAGYIYECDMESPDSISCFVIADADDIEIHCYVYLDNYLIFGMGDGKIRINRIKSAWRDLSDYWMLSMHDNFFGKIPTIKFSFDNKFLFSIGLDGNLFSYSWNLPLKEIRPVIPVAVPKLERPVYDIDGKHFLSLEQEKQKQNEEKRQKIASNSKDKVLELISDLRKEFDEIMIKNAKLPDSQKLTPLDLELDSRLTDNLQNKLDRQMDVVRRKKEFDFEKVKLAGRKLMEYFIEPLQDFPIQVIGINNDKTVYTFRIRKLGEDYFRLKDELECKIRELSKKKRMDVDLSLRTMETESSVHNVESFLIGLTPSDIEMKLESKMRRLLNKYRERKAKELARKKEWEAVYAEKPNPNRDHPSDVKVIAEAQQTIGDYKLKTDPNFEVIEEGRDTTIKKLQELLKTREDIFNIRNDYNQRIFGLRSKKKELIDYIRNKLKKLVEIHMEIPLAKRATPKINVKFNHNLEFPERNFNLKKYLAPHGFDSEHVSMESRSRSETPWTEDEKNLLNAQRDILSFTPFSFENVASSKLSVQKLFKSKETRDKLSNWENDLKNLRTRRKLFEQQQIIDKINLRIGEFDSEIGKLSSERYEIEVKAKFKELYLLTLNQELMILKDFEKLEEKMVEDVEGKMLEKRQMTQRIAQTSIDIEGHKKAIEDLQGTRRVVEQKFHSKCMENKFAPFLKMIFKKKIRMTDENRRNEEDEETDKELSDTDESSSSEEDSQDGSSTNMEIGLKYLNEDECPKNCDRQLYNLAFELRRERHELERTMRAKEREIDNYQLQLELLTEGLEKTENDYKEKKMKLSEFRHQKQQMLNEVDMLVVLKMEQMQYFKTHEEFEDIDNTLLFNSHNVTKLYARVGQLALETIEAKRKHRINVVHLAKMKTDIKFMEKQITDLKDETNQAMLKKFGRVIDLNEVEETILRRFAFEMQVEMRANADDIRRQYLNKINELKKSRTNKQEELNRVIQEATEKLNILTVLEEEKNFLHRIGMIQNRKKELRSAGGYREIGNDLTKLREISNHQKSQIEMLQREIRALSLKSKSFVDSRQEFEKFNYKVHHLGECRGFEDSIISNVDESMRSSTRGTTPDHEIFNGIYKTVNQYLEENLSNQLQDDEMNNVASNMSKYLTNVAMNYDASQSDSILPDVINSFRSYLPRNIEVSPKSVASMVAQVVTNFDIEDDVNPGVVVREIVSNVIESSQSVMSSHSYLQHIVTEILKQMIITMRFADISSPECTLEVINRLAKFNAIQTKEVSVDEIVEDVLEHAAENLETNIDDNALKTVVSHILTKLNL